MPDLSNAASHQFWHDYPDPIIYRVISFLEGVEDWTLDGNEALETALQQLGIALDDIGNIDLENRDEFIKAGAFLKSGRTLRLLQALDTAYPGAASKILLHAEESSESSNDVPGLFLRKNVIFERLRLLSRIFSTQRFTLINKALEDEDEI